MNKQELDAIGLGHSDTQQNVPSPDFRKLYVNNVMIGASNFDMNLTFGEILGVDENGRPIVEQKVKLNMSKEFMKALTNLLSLNIQKYEAMFGPITFVNIENMPETAIDHSGQEVSLPVTTTKKRKK